MRKTHGQSGFTLIELMLVVGIIGAMAAIAIPNFMSYQARSRRSEAFTNLAAMASAQKAFQAERNYFHDSLIAGIGADVPDILNYGGAWSTKKMPWDADAKAAFSDLGWEPEGEVFYSYASYTAQTASTGPNCGSCALCFTGAAYGDVDGDGHPQTILYVHHDLVGGADAWCNEGLNNDPPAIDSAGNFIFDAVAARSNSDY
ncbi:MAG TPA: prepilin-type N-terminal cleavage/methylation domain-containing protein [Myxococcota bacterium]|nr:prepilin-type N-terminal cleavage/methylation domain-containing protein [Myxococcota bacterium]